MTVTEPTCTPAGISPARILPPLPPARPCEYCGGMEDSRVGLKVHASRVCPGVAFDLIMFGSALAERAAQ